MVATDVVSGYGEVTNLVSHLRFCLTRQRRSFVSSYTLALILACETGDKHGLGLKLCVILASGIGQALSGPASEIGQSSCLL